jgi:hypothetical protein
VIGEMPAQAIGELSESKYVVSRCVVQTVPNPRTSTALSAARDLPSAFSCTPIADLSK